MEESAEHAGKLSCTQCGEHVPVGSDLGNDAMVNCPACGHEIQTAGAIRAEFNKRAMDINMAAAKKAAKDAWR